MERKLRRGQRLRSVDPEMDAVPLVIDLFGVFESILSV